MRSAIKFYWLITALCIVLLGYAVSQQTKIPDGWFTPRSRWVPGPVLTVPADRQLLEKFRGARRMRLLHYLASNAIWRVSTSEYLRDITNVEDEVLNSPGWQHGFIASLRLTPSFFAEEPNNYSERAVSEFNENWAALGSSMCNERNAQTRDQWERHLSAPNGLHAVSGLEPNWSMQILVAIKGDEDPIDKSADKPQADAATIKTYTFHGPGGGNRADLELRGHEVSIIIFENAKPAQLKFGNKVFAFVQNELKKIDKAIEKGEELDRSLLAKGSTIAANADSFQPLREHVLTGYVNPGKAGTLTFNCVGHGWLQAALVVTGGSNETVVSGWSSDKNERFFFAVPYMINTGDGPGTGFSEKDFDFALRFKPLDGSATTVLWKPGT